LLFAVKKILFTYKTHEIGFTTTTNKKIYLKTCYMIVLQSIKLKDIYMQSHS